ncbi:transposase [Streptomyces sp. NRRL S-495]|uniref:transposase n=1 Tax=Streptomyces sp. NRRL S-495 TaxID=1609133 RepID=UPI000D149C1F|nr:transposase [Streptomyces sp. NRRL S-495]
MRVCSTTKAPCTIDAGRWSERRRADVYLLGTLRRGRGPLRAPRPAAPKAGNSATCKSASEPSSGHPDGRPANAVRSGIEGTINELTHGHGMRRCRYRGRPKTHMQHVLTAIAANLERLGGRPASGETPIPRPSTAFQAFLDDNGIPRPKSWRTLGT